MATLEERLREARQKRSLTQAQIAEALNVRKQTITMYETGKLYPSLAALVKLENVLGIPAGDLILASTYAKVAMEVARALYKRINEN